MEVFANISTVGYLHGVWDEGQKKIVYHDGVNTNFHGKNIWEFGTLKRDNRAGLYVDLNDPADLTYIPNAREEEEAIQALDDLTPLKAWMRMHREKVETELYPKSHIRLLRKFRKVLKFCFVSTKMF